MESKELLARMRPKRLSIGIETENMELINEIIDWTIARLRVHKHDTGYERITVQDLSDFRKARESREG